MVQDGRHAAHVRYRAVRADDQEWRNVKRPKVCPLTENLCLLQVVAGKLRPFVPRLAKT